MKALQLTTDKLIGIFFLVCGAIYLFACKSLNLGTVSSPGEGFIPAIIGSLLAIFSIILLCRREKDVESKEPPLERYVIVRIIKVAVASLVYVLFISLIGFKLSTLLVLTVTVRIFGNTNWKGNLIFSIITTIFTVLLFQVWLQLPLPEPILNLILSS